MTTTNPLSPEELAEQKVVETLCELETVTPDDVRYAIGSLKAAWSAAQAQGAEGEGHERLWRWFGLSYATFLTLPRVLLHAMPDSWQFKMAALLEEADEAFPNAPGGFTVRGVGENGRLTKLPHWLLNYRYPDRAAIDACRPTPPEQHSNGGGE